ncbi:MAG: Nramp family divalent metal transporter [Spirochaetota bacterium]
MILVKLQRVYFLILPSLLTAMTGVGVGDLATASFVGAHLGLAVLWAILLGGVFKFVLTEGIARWQLASNLSVIQGGIIHLKLPFILFMAIYFIPWCWFVGGALINAAGVAGKEIAFLFGWDVSKTSTGIAHSVLALAVLLIGKQKLFDKAMSLLAALLFVIVIACTLLVPIDAMAVVKGLLAFQLPVKQGALSWTLALMGGVGGTLTILCYGYWLAGSERQGVVGLQTSRLDIAISYSLTCLFGICMLIIGSVAVQEGKGLSLLLSISQYFSQNIHPLLGSFFLFAAWAAIFSSMLGVWQSVPLIFADAYYKIKQRNFALEDLPHTSAYKGWLVTLAVVPMFSLVFSFQEMQKLYSLIGSLFMPILAFTLLYLNNKYISKEFKNSTFINVCLALVFLFFVATGLYKLL